MADPKQDDLVKETWKALAGLGETFRAEFEKHFEEAQYRVDKEIGKQLAKHPELYADLKRGYRQLRKTMDKVASDIGLK